MKNVAIICAAPHFEFNPGMHSVDLGAFYFFNSHFSSEQVNLTFYIIHKPDAKLDSYLKDQLPFKYEILLNKLDALYEHDLIVYWGDFLHNQLYHKNLAKRLVSYNLVETNDAEETINQHFFLSNAPIEVLQKTIVFGSNFFINPPESFLDHSYSKYCTRFFNNINRVWVRDVLSSLRIGHLTKNYTTNHLGIDCSFFFNLGIKVSKSNAHIELEKKRWINKLFPTKIDYNAGIFLGRMHGSFEPIFPLINTMQKELHLSTNWIHWFWQNDEFYTSVKKSLPQVKFSTESNSIMDLYESLKTYDFIITDTYHLCLNAWKMGVPAICIGTATSPLEGTLTDKKKEFFYNMYEAQDFYLFLEDIKDSKSRKAKIKQLSEKLSNKNLHTNISNNILSHKKEIESQLHETIKTILNK